MARDSGDRVDRRELLKYLGVGSLTAASAGCMGGSPPAGGGGGENGSGGNASGGGGGGGDALAAAQEVGFADNWKDRRMASLDEWPLEKREQIPPEGKRSDVKPWRNSGAVKSAPWSPPDGWEETPAGDVEKLQILNFGSLDYDPATVATYAMFEEATGIEIEPLEIVVDQAVSKEAAFLSANKGQPQGFLVVTGQSLTSFVQNGYLQQVDPVMGEEEMWDPYLSLAENNFQIDGHTYLSPNINEGSLVHTRPKLMRENGVDDETVQRILDGEYDWNDMETVMEAFKGTGIAGWAYRGASLVYTVRDWMKMFYQAGGQIVGDDGTVTFNSEAGIVALQKMVEWREKGLVPKEVVNYTQGDLADGFLSGQIAMVPVFGDLVPRAVEQHGKAPNYRPTVQPKGGESAPNPKRRGIAAPTGFGINVNADVGHKLAAMLYMDARWSVPSGWFEFVVEGNQTYAKDVYDQASETDAALFADVRGRAVENNVQEIYPQSRTIRQTLSEELQTAIAGDKSPEEALNAVQEFADTVLGQNE
ncbi:ABC transporter substrate-binding protein [Halobium salinum]|uniref:ABC transporter substrate-binding protein n=1 Tax=Halobium salinum TaxID=1364940 RepID=A0ABD5PHM0_9EURY|nr:extracellular solute-binding protein [Halobium salinum]